jgi:hypothetical protein
MNGTPGRRSFASSAAAASLRAPTTLWRDPGDATFNHLKCLQVRPIYG